jgi:hypothetical protein
MPDSARESEPDDLEAAIDEAITEHGDAAPLCGPCWYLEAARNRAIDLVRKAQ